jgi:5'-nucleotidase (lipoprotein e(P4) family)
MLKRTAPLFFALLAACVPIPPVATAPPAAGLPAATSTAAYPADLLWVRTAAEHRALFEQTYRAAREKLLVQAHGRQAGTWGVVVDADETLLDNSEYQRRLHVARERFDNETWNAWVRERAAGALPGARDYTEAVRSLGGRVVVVTNRDEVVCDPTRENLRSLGFTVDLVLCKTDVSDKNPRFQAVERGTTGSGLPALQIVQYVGDNIQDFPEANQQLRDADRSALAAFGDRYWVLPNPMYGSFERNPPR